MEFAIFGRNLANKKYLTRSFADLYRSLGIATQFSGCVRHVLQLGGHGAGHAALRSSVYFCSRSSYIIRERLASSPFSWVSTARAGTTSRQRGALGTISTT